MEKKTNGQIAYEAYLDASGGKSPVSKEKLPTWEKVKPEIQAAWEQAAQAVVNKVFSPCFISAEKLGTGKSDAEVRDEFAREAMGSLAVKWANPDDEAIAQKAYRIADAMMAKRNAGDEARRTSAG